MNLDKFREAITRGINFFEGMVSKDPSLEMGIVYCQDCGKVIKVNPVKCLQTGWPKCCGHTMSLKKENKPLG